MKHGSGRASGRTINLHEPIDQRISFNRFVDALEAGEEAADAPPMSGEAFERVRAAVKADASLGAAEKELQKVLKRAATKGGGGKKK